ncbi:MAG: alanine dehydrogenase, partial [Calditrichia bacterium]
GSYAHTNAIVPYLQDIGGKELLQVIKRRPALKRGINTFEGELVHPVVAAALGKKVERKL